MPVQNTGAHVPSKMCYILTLTKLVIDRIAIGLHVSGKIIIEHLSRTGAAPGRLVVEGHRADQRTVVDPVVPFMRFIFFLRFEHRYRCFVDLQVPPRFGMLYKVFVEYLQIIPGRVHPVAQGGRGYGDTMAAKRLLLAVQRKVITEFVGNRLRQHAGPGNRLVGYLIRQIPHQHSGIQITLFHVLVADITLDEGFGRDHIQLVGNQPADTHLAGQITRRVDVTC